MKATVVHFVVVACMALADNVNNREFASKGDTPTKPVNSEATTRKRQLDSEATTWKRQLVSDNLKATTRKRQLGKIYYAGGRGI